jgi:hypothetical protein
VLYGTTYFGGRLHGNGTSRSRPRVRST